MSGITVFLTIIGLCLIIGSFIFFEKEDTSPKKQVVMLNDYELDEAELAKLQESIRAVVKEYSDELVSATEEQLQETCNQKMLEMNELAEQILADIEKARQECVFLFDMLEDRSTT